jgi:NAD(P)-dependent dehydrogenase (short-subunit alcohol dehydrogenase family)
MFDNRVVLITGAGSGIGRQLAIELSRRGAVIAALDLAPEPLQSLATELKAHNAGIGWEVGDVTDRASLHRAVAAFQQRVGPIEILVANAGIGFETSARDWKAEDFEKHIAVNLVGVSNSIEAVLPGMLQRKHGHLVAMSSVASYRGVPRLTAYCAGKAGVNALMEGLRVELKPMGIHCTTICPGWIRTPLTDKVKLPMPGILSVENACRRIADAIERRRPFYAFPSQLRWTLQIAQLLPARWSDWMLLNVLRRSRR